MAPTKPVSSTKKKKQVVSRIPRKSIPDKTLLTPTDRLRIHIKTLNARVSELEQETEKLTGIRSRFEAQIKAHRHEYDSLRQEVRALTCQLQFVQEELNRAHKKLSDPNFGTRPRKRRH